MGQLSWCILSETHAPAASLLKQLRRRVCVAKGSLSRTHPDRRCINGLAGAKGCCEMAASERAFPKPVRRYTTPIVRASWPRPLAMLERSCELRRRSFVSPYPLPTSGGLEAPAAAMRLVLPTVTYFCAPARFGGPDCPFPSTHRRLARGPTTTNGVVGGVGQPSLVGVPLSAPAQSSAGGSHSSTRLPSGSVSRAKRPVSGVSQAGSVVTAIPAFPNPASSASRSVTR